MGGSHITEIRTALYTKYTHLNEGPKFAKLPLMSLIIDETAIVGQQ